MLSENIVPHFSDSHEAQMKMKNDKTRQAARLGSLLSSYSQLSLEPTTSVGITEGDETYFIPYQTLRRVSHSLWEDLHTLGDGKKADKLIPLFAPPKPEK